MRIVFCSCPLQEAMPLARGIIDASLAACVQVVPQIQSVYRWKGQVCEDNEALLLCKTTASSVSALTLFLKNNHSYEVPEVVSVAIEPEEGNPAYLAWLVEQVGGGALGSYDQSEGERSLIEEAPSGHRSTRRDDHDTSKAKTRGR